MKLISTVLGAFLFMSASSFSTQGAATPELKAPDFAVTLSKSAGAPALVASPASGYHINVKAPMSLEVDGKPGKHKPLKSSAETALFRLPASPGGEPRKLWITLFLCDDKETFCERHRVPVRWDGSSLTAGGAAASDAAASDAQAKPRNAGAARAEIDEDGFIINRPEIAIARAQAEKKPLLIDFYGIWCPPCNEYNELVFPTREFREQSKKFVKLKLDVDTETSWALKGRYKITGYPTVVFATSSLDEITRIIGFRPKELFLKQMKSAYDAREEAYTTLKAKADAGDTASRRKVGRILLDREEFALALPYLQDDPESAEQAAAAEIGIAEQAHDPAKLVAALEKGIAAFPKDPDSIDWRVELAQAYVDLGGGDAQAKSQAMLREAIANARELIAAPDRIGDRDLTVADLWTTVADAQEKLKEDAKPAWLSAAAEYGRGADSDHERGYNLEKAACLWHGGEYTQADRIYRALEKHYPEEFTFYFNHARMKLQQKRFSDASSLAKKALKYSYGDNRLRVVYVLASSLRDGGKKPEARKLLENTLAEASTPSDSQIRTHRYVESLQKLLNDIKKD